MRFRWSQVGVGAVGLLTGFLCLGSLSADLGQVAPQGAVAVRHPSVTVPVTGLITGLELSLNGEPVQVKPSSDGYETDSLDLPEGVYQARVVASTALPFQTLEHHWQFEVDRTAPGLTLDPVPTFLAGTELELGGQVDEGCRLEIGGQSEEIEGSFSVTLPLSAGLNRLRGRLVDAAGNVTPFEAEVFSDLESPRAAIFPGDGQRVDQVAPVIEVRPSDDGEVAEVSIQLDGQPLQVKEKKPGLYRAWGGKLTEGSRRLEVVTRDRAGRETRDLRHFLVDSTEEFGSRPMSLGAVGEDVRQLQQRLVEQKLLGKNQVSGYFDPITEHSVKAFQKQEGFESTGVVDSRAMVALGPRIAVHLGRFELVLDRPRKPLRRFSVATGSPSYPTTPGRYKVAEKVMHPTWLPPKSDWARDAEPVPPGPNNPLGTRWIGLDWGGLGIHGTNAPWSIGSASSHGCMRMRLDEVESLFSLVEVGTPVYIFTGQETDQLVRDYWP